MKNTTYKVTGSKRTFSNYEEAAQFAQETNGTVLVRDEVTGLWREEHAASNNLTNRAEPARIYFMTKMQKAMIERITEKGPIVSWLDIQVMKNTAFGVKTFQGQQNNNVRIAQQLLSANILVRANAEQKAAWFAAFDRTTARYERHLAHAVSKKNWKVVESLSSDLQGRSAYDRKSEGELLFVLNPAALEQTNFFGTA